MIIYSLLSFFIAPWYLLGLLLTRNLGNIWHRLGLLPTMPAHSVWLHAASMGEMASLHGLVGQITGANKPLIITTNTHTGYAYITKHFPQATPAFFPLDTPLTITLALKRTQARYIIVTEAERWLCLLKRARRSGTIKVIAYNTYLRASSGTFKRFWYRQLYQHCHEIYTQEQTPFINLSLPTTTIHSLGSPKATSVQLKKEHFPLSPATAPLPVLLVGSVHPDELSVYLSLWHHLVAHDREVHMILVPRHLHWVDSLHEQVNALATTTYHFSAAAGDTPTTTAAAVAEHLHTPGITTVSVLGVLYDLYQHATIFYLGGTFNALGGHNVLEPAVWQLPILTGPTISQTNFEALALERVGGLARCIDSTELIAATEKLLDNRDTCTQTGIKNAAWTKAHAAQDIKL